MTSRDLRERIDTSFQTMQRDLFESGTVARIGVNAFAVWQAIKAHADYQTGVCWPSIRRLMALTGLASQSVQGALAILQGAHMLRVRRQGRRNYYIARERMDLRLGELLICTVVVDYVPASLRETLPKVKELMEGKGAGDPALLAQIEILPGEGFVWDGRSLKRELPMTDLAALEAAYEGSFTARIHEIQMRAAGRKSPVDKS
jgi:DNA-binding transcriptional ArsR family regulator